MIMKKIKIGTDYENQFAQKFYRLLSTNQIRELGIR